MSESNVTELRPVSKRQSEIKMFFHCALCFEELPGGVSPGEYSCIESGWTLQGFQVWCRRHNANIIHVDFEGQKHPTLGTS